MRRIEQSEVDEAIKILDSKYKSWDLWRCQPSTAEPKKWLVKMFIDGDRNDQEVITAESLLEALQQAADFVPLPRIPREPFRYRRSGFTVRKDKYRQWVLEYPSRITGGMQWVTSAKTKKTALELADKLTAGTEAVFEAWQKQYRGIVDSGTEGVDFRWSE